MQKEKSKKETKELCIKLKNIKSKIINKNKNRNNFNSISSNNNSHTNTSRSSTKFNNRRKWNNNKSFKSKINIRACNI